MDVLSDVLDTIRLQGTLYFTTEFNRPWGVRVPAHRRVARFHLVVRGSTWVRVEGRDEPLHLEAGDLVLVPFGAEHVLSDEPDTQCKTVDQIIEETGFTGEGVLVFGGGDPTRPTQLVCGHFDFDDDLRHPLVDQLPAAFVVRWDEAARGSPLEDAFRFIAREAREGRPGHAAVVKRLSEILFVQIVRHWAAQNPPDQGFLRALSDPGLTDALGAIHRDPAAPWTLDALARKAAMSRTAFVERFRESIGETPHRYLVQWRMQRAKTLLRESALSLARIAPRVGYDSPASFSRAFKKEVGVPPGEFRQSRQEAVVGRGREPHSLRSATMGSRREAFHAG